MEIHPQTVTLLAFLSLILPYFCFYNLVINRLKYLNLEHNEISSVPHLRLLGARVRQEDTSRQENEGGNSSLSNVPEEKEKGEREGVSENNVEVENDKDRENGADFILDEVDDILNQNLVPDEQTDERDRPKIKPRSSTFTEDPSLLGKFVKCFEHHTGRGRGGEGRGGHYYLC